MHPPEDVRAYPRPPHVESVTMPARIVVDDQVACETDDVVRVLETWHPPTLYLPRSSFAPGLLEMARDGRTTTCEWKGVATYLDVLTNAGRRLKRVGWTYLEPRPGYELLAGRVAVYPGRMDRCELDGEAVVAQPGDFYGGWITSWITGPVKGAPGTNHW